MPLTDPERRAELRHFVRNHLAAVRNAAFYLQRRSEGSELWTSDPRFAEFFALIARSVEAIDAKLTTELASAPNPVTAPAAPTSALAGTRALVVDDHDGARATICALLADEGATVDEASSFAQADACLDAGDGPAYDLVLLDRGLGDRDGHELVPQIRARHPAAKIVVVSGAASEAMPGVDASIGKELDFEELLTRVRALLGAG